MEIPLSSPIEYKISWSQKCYQELRDQLVRDKKIIELLNRLKNAVQASGREMEESGVVNECRKCEEGEGGSCCGAGLENKYSGTLLLINLLLDVKLPHVRYDPTSCFFLGKSGCLLQARHVICINYLCRKITDSIDGRKISALREKEGEEIETLFFLNEQIKTMLRA